MSLRAVWALLFVALVATGAMAGSGPDCSPPNFCLWVDDDACGRCFDAQCDNGAICQVDGDCAGIGSGLCNHDASTWKTCTVDAECTGIGLAQCWGLCNNDRTTGCQFDVDCAAVGGTCDTSPVGTGTPGDPFCRIQRAYNGATNSDPPTSPSNPIIVAVQPGDYSECIVAWGFVEDGFGEWDPVLSRDLPVEMVAVDYLVNGDNTSTVIDGTATCGPDVEDPLVPGSTVKIGGTGARLEGFTITGAAQSGVFAQGEVTITNNVISGNQSDLGGGVYLLTASCYYEVLVDAVISNNVIENNDSAAPLSALVPDCQVCASVAPCGTGDGGGIFAAVDDRLNCGTTTDHVDITGNTVRFNTVTNFNPDYCTAICENSPDPDNPTPCDQLALPCPTGQGPCVAQLPYTASGAGIFVLTDSQSLRSAGATITQNLIAGNSITSSPPAQFSEGYGGGIYAVTFGYGADTIDIADNCVGGDDVDCSVAAGTGNSSTLDGGGISARARPFQDGAHRINIHGNKVVGNAAGRDGGGLELLTEVIELGAGTPTGDAAVLTTSGNEIADNTSDRDGGGVKAVSDVRRTVSSTAEMGLTLTGNSIHDNTSGLGAGGVLAIPIADYDDVTGGLCGANPSPAESRIDVVQNLIVDNTASATDPNIDVIGGGILALPLTFGEARATVRIDQTTVAGNTIGSNGIVGGVEAQAITRPDCLTQTLLGSSHLVLDRTIVANNTCPNSLQCIGVGGPPPQVDVLIASAASCDVFGHSPNYESSLFPSSPPPGNISGNPQLDAGTYFPAACSPVFARFCHGSLASCDVDGDCGQFCSASADVPFDPCTVDGDCPNGTCLQRCVDEVGFYANPDTTGDGAIDGQEVLGIAASFGAEQGVDPRYDPSVDINRNGMNDGDDLSFFTSEFGQVCQP